MSQKQPQPVRRGVGELVFQTIQDLHNAGRIATRPIVKEMTGQSYSVVDDHVKRMLEDGRLRRVAPGVFEPVEELPETRAVSLSRLPNGMWKLEIGDLCADLTPSEARAIASMLSGTASEMSSIQNGRDIADGIADLQRQLANERRARERLQESMRRLLRQPKQEELPFI